MVSIDFSELDQFNQAVETIGEEFTPSVVRFLERVGQEIESRILTRASAHIYTGEWIRSFRTIVGEENGHAFMQMGHLDIESGSRLPIYWKVLERGADPNPNIPVEALLVWSQAVTGSTLAGVTAIMVNQLGIFGIEPNPIISLSFVLDSEFEVVDFTSETEVIWEQGLEEFGRNLEVIFFRTGPQKRRRSPITGRFIPT
jgi:hypothetical protein